MGGLGAGRMGGWEMGGFEAGTMGGTFQFFIGFPYDILILHSSI